MNKLLISQVISFVVFPLCGLSQLFSGDLAFIGYNSDGGTGTNDNFSFVTLTNVPASQVIYFTEEGWDNLTGDWVGTSEGHITYTAPAAGLPCGTVISINETGTSTFTVSGGGTAVLGSGSGWSLSGGDQVLAYLAGSPEPAITPTFIAGVHGDDGNGSPISLNPATGWNDSDLLSPLGTARSEVPPGLTNGVDCVSLFPTVGTEQDNAKYTGSLSGTSTTIRTAINDRTNWSVDNSTPFAIEPGDYSPSISCVSLPVALYSFNALLIDNRFVKIVWQTASETNNSHFEVERSSDGFEWEIVNTINGAGSSNNKLSYSVVDLNPYSGLSYYRLKQTDFDGQFEYSNVISMTVKVVNGGFGEFYPNPSNSGLVYLDYTAVNAEEINIYVFNMAGELVAYQLKQLTKGDSILSFDLTIRDQTGRVITLMNDLHGSQTILVSDFASGIYHITLSMAGSTVTRKFVKE